MLAKKELMRTLKTLGFEKKENSRTAGSHIAYSHKKFHNIVVGITDHKDTKDISPMVYNDIINAITMVVLIQCKEKDKVDYAKAKALLKNVDEELSRDVISRIKRIDFKDKLSMGKLMSRSMVAKLTQIYGKIDNNIIEEYLLIPAG